MIQVQREFLNELSLYHEKILNQVPQIQKIFSTPHFIALRLRVPQNTFYLYLGRGKGNEGIWNSETSPPSEIRVVDYFCEYFRKHLGNARVIKLLYKKDERILFFNYFLNKKRMAFGLFWNGPSLFLAHYFYENNKAKCFFSWGRGERPFLEKDLDDENFLFASFDDIQRSSKKSEIGQECRCFDAKSYFDSVFEGAERAQLKIEKKKIKFLNRKMEKIQKDIEKAMIWLELFHEINKNDFLIFYNKQIKDNISNQIFTYKELKIKISRSYSVYQIKDFFYKKIKGMRKGLEILKTREREVKSLLDKNQKIQDRNIEYKFQITSPIWPKKSSKKNKNKVDQVSKDYDEYFIGSDKIFVGKTASGNDHLRNFIGNKEDYWFHLENDKSAHLIIKQSKSTDLDPYYFETIGSIIRDYSGFDYTEFDLIYSKLKNIKGVKGAPGKVLVKKKKIVRVSYNQKWKEIISQFSPN